MSDQVDSGCLDTEVPIYEADNFEVDLEAGVPVGWPTVSQPA
jgi:hypothetical protein